MLSIEIYRKTLRRRDLAVATSQLKNEEDDTIENQDAKESSTGTIVNLMSTDATRIAEFSQWWFAFFEIPTELTVGICFLYQLLGKSCFLGLLVMVIVLPLNHFNAKMYTRTQDRLMEARDKRVSLMNEVLQGIRQIKFFAWEKRWEQRVMEARQIELHHLSVTYLSGVLFNFLWQGYVLLTWHM